MFSNFEDVEYAGGKRRNMIYLKKSGKKINIIS